MRPTAAEDYDEQEVNRVRALPDEEFVQLVFAETRSVVDPPTAAALRAPSVLRRWDDALKLILGTVQSGLDKVRGVQEPQAVEQRNKLARREHLVRTRLMETKRLKREQHEVWVYEGKVNQERNKQQRNTAGDAAIQRLIDAHPEEYRKLLDEERRNWKSSPADSAEWAE
ncbi:hypothetical protein AB0L71_28555 [Streptomyces sp. NPDC052052]|uniref:hypothetical protein n=1 Tax=Streptomyces sp. NPDC052052 TaxID=3154756 RepID=UPI00342159BB